MNEDDLKEVWRKSESISLDCFDFEKVRQIARQSQKKLRRKINLELGIGIVLYILITPLFFTFTNLLPTIPIIIALWAWYLWETRRIYRLEADFQNHANLKEFLQKKEQFISGYIRRNRLFYLVIPVIFALFFVAIDSFEGIIKKPVAFLTVLIISQILCVVIIEINFRLVYISPLDETKNLLRQLDDETQ